VARPHRPIITRNQIHGLGERRGQRHARHLRKSSAHRSESYLRSDANKRTTTGTTLPRPFGLLSTGVLVSNHAVSASQT
jgi:hypothetical protein